MPRCRSLTEEAEKIDFKGRLSLKDVSFVYRSVPVLEAVNLEIPSGARVAIFGANGSGKTTLLQHPSRSRAPNNGTRSG